MTRSPLAQFLVGVLVAAALAGLILAMVLGRSRGSPGDTPTAVFARSVDLTPLDRAAVHSEGRFKSFDSFAREIVGYVSGPRRIEGLPPDFVYLDLMIRPDEYRARPTVYIKQKDMRAQIAAALGADGSLPPDQQAEFMKSGLIAPLLLQHPQVSTLLERWSMDVVKTAKHVDAIRAGAALTDPVQLAGLLALIPPPRTEPEGGMNSPWLNTSDLWSGHAGIEPAETTPSRLDPATLAQLRGDWTSVVTSWRALDAPGTNAALARFCTALIEVNPQIYPDATKMRLESLYFGVSNLTWVWVLYLVALALLLMAVAYRWPGAARAGMGAFTVAFALHTLALVWRWYVSGRWPNSNMFEAVTTSVWLGTVLALGIELWARRTPMRGLFALTSAGACMAAMMAAHFVPAIDDRFNANINNMMPVLHDLWLYIHTNVIICSYALIAMASVTAALYLVVRLRTGDRSYARVGGAAALMDGARPGGAAPRSFAAILDGATMVLMELSFVMLWAGIVMGAIWADHSWGRPWGWDPKEVFALNTFLVFLVLVHVRLKVADKAMWTAILAIAGCAVMLFNWIVINFVISGLHSYA